MDINRKMEIKIGFLLVWGELFFVSFSRWLVRGRSERSSAKILGRMIAMKDRNENWKVYFARRPTPYAMPSIRIVSIILSYS